VVLLTPGQLAGTVSPRFLMVSGFCRLDVLTPSRKVTALGVIFIKLCGKPRSLNSKESVQQSLKHGVLKLLVTSVERPENEPQLVLLTHTACVPRSPESLIFHLHYV
jgi:hypothetical protein